MKKKLLILPALVLTAAMAVTGCQTTDTPAGNTTAATTAPTTAATAQTATAEPGGIQVSDPDTFPIVEEKVTLNFFSQLFPLVEDMDTNLTTLWYEEKTNVHINWELIPGADLQTKLSLSLASGSYPDVYWLAGLSVAQVLLYGTQGVLIPLNDLIEEQGVYTKIAFEERPDVLDAVTAPDGNIYSLFKTDGGLHMITPQKMFVYQPWLDQLGLSMPQTTEDFKAMLMEFRDNDMNGNGDASDEIPLTGSDIAGFLMNPFQLSPTSGSKKLMLVDGQVVPSYTQDGYKQGLQYLKDLCDEGLLSKEAFVIDSSQLKALINREDGTLVGCTPSLWQGAFVDRSVLADGYIDYVPVPPLTGPTGLTQTPYNYGDVSIGLAAITMDCEYPEVALKWMDWFYSYEGTTRIQWGREGIEHDWFDEPSINGKDKGFRRLIAFYAESQNNTWFNTQSVQYYTPDMRYSEIREEGAPGTILYDASMIYMDDVSMDVLPSILWMTEDQANQISQMETLILDYVNESTAQFIIGERDIETGWDQYLTDLDNMGLSAYIRLYQDIIDAMN